MKSPDPGLPSKEQVLLRYSPPPPGEGEDGERGVWGVIRRARIPTTTVIHAGTKLSKLVKAYNDLKKKKGTKGQAKNIVWMRRFSKEPSKKSSTRTSLSPPTARRERTEDKEFLRSQEKTEGNHPWLELTS
ncbi:hypothetical protein GWK47_027599 [Chionoecetes opilio]|uniref:Uncharacterized protein n=1 Tax=Chionoecetes opilio TaxID=41210 RepID=A0A8J8WC66_CHIOP|nr:hypothetical protein GWK47_027599 [Chionoecetes opilio]